MPDQDDFDWLCIELNQCIAQAEAMKLGHAALLMKMALMEVVDRADERGAGPVRSASMLRQRSSADRA